MLKLLKWPAIYTLYVELTGASVSDVQRQIGTFKRATLELLSICSDGLAEVSRLVQAL